MDSNFRIHTLVEIERRATRLECNAANLIERLEKARNARVTSGAVLGAALVVCAVLPRIRGELWIILAFAVVFIPLVVRSRALERSLVKFRALAKYYRRCAARRRGCTPELPPDASYSNKQTLTTKISESASARSLDLALDGPRSLRALLDETWTDGGRTRLRERILSDPPASAQEACARQAETKALAVQRWALIRLGLLCNRSDARVSTHELARFSELPLLPASAARAAVVNIALWIVALATVALYGAGLVPGGWPALLIAVYVVVGMQTLSSWGPVFMRAEGFAHHLSTLAPLFARLEQLAAQRSAFTASLPALVHGKPTDGLRRLDRCLAFASVESSPILSFVVNGLAPWSVLADLALERARAGLARNLPTILTELHEFEFRSSIALYAAEHGGAWPEFVADSASLSFVNLTHPLMDSDRAVGNALTLNHGSSLALLTGSNMSGKSTFLRSIGLNQVLANLGAPARATEYKCAPFAIETCIQITDSLADGTSYFYAEVLRLKHLLMTASSGRPTLALIDEIFRGTNNRERRIGSEAVIRALAGAGRTMAIVSTHDLELAALEGACPGVGNWHFRDQVIDGRLAFSYKLEQGACPTTNAVRLMRLEGLPVQDLADT